MVKMLQKTLGAGKPGVGCGISFGIRRGGCSSSRPPRSHMRRDRGPPATIFPALLTVCPGQQGTASHQKSHLAKQTGLLTNPQTLLCPHQALIKENTTDRYPSRPGKASLLPIPHHLIPSTKMRGGGCETGRF